MREIANVMGYVLKHYNGLPNYFFMQILIEVMIESGRITNFQTENDCKPHYLQQLINDPSFNLATFSEIIQMTSIHKLTYKSEGIADKLRKLIEEYE